MNKKLIWRGKGPIMYEIDIYKQKLLDPEGDWKYVLSISGSGPYANAYLGEDTEDIDFLADTKEGIIRDLAIYINNQITDKNDRKILGMPPDPLNLQNVIIHDHTDTNEFADIDIPTIFKNSEILSNEPPPPGEYPFIVKIYNSDDPGYYDILINPMDPLVMEELENLYNYGGDGYYYDVPAQDVLKTIRDELSTMSLKYNNTEISPNINNTKLINHTDNPEFTLSRLYSITTPLQLTHKSPTLKFPKKELNVIESPIIQYSIPIPTPVNEQLKKKQTNVENEKERLKA